MNRMTKKYWIGKRKDSRFRWLFDRGMPHEDSRMVYLFNANSGCMNEHLKVFAREVLVTAGEADRTAVIAAYEKWYAANGATFLKNDESRRRRATLERNAKEEADATRRAARMEARHQEVEVRRQEIIDLHKEHVEISGRGYAGVAENSNRSHRVTHCYSCREHLASELHMACLSCNWLICRCGACGCGYQE